MTEPRWSLAEQIALSFDGPASPSMALRGQTEDQADLIPSRWGLAWYDDNQRSVSSIRDADLPVGTPLAAFLETRSPVRSCLVLGQTDGYRADGDTDDRGPLVRSYAGRRWIFSLIGTLDPELRIDLALHDDAFDIAPVGQALPEHAFAWILASLRAAGARTIDEFGWKRLHDGLRRINDHGPCAVLLSDGIDLVAYRDAGDGVPLHWSRRRPPHEDPTLHGRAFMVEHDGPLDGGRTLLALSTLPMRGSRWTPLEPGEMRVARRAQSVWSSHPAGLEEHPFVRLGEPHAPRALTEPGGPIAAQQQHASAPVPDLQEVADPDREPGTATLSVVHETRYTYTEPVERSSHRFCLRPVGDDRQVLLHHDFTISVDGQSRDFEDVFGNRARQLEVTRPFTDMHIVSHSTVRVEGVVASQLKTSLRRDQIPLVWMPWQRQMMQAYLMPPELPEPELRELSEFAMSFVERNDYDLVETLLDMNRTIYRDFDYVSGSTTVETTPFQVYTTRKGVCQDFANVLICIARLLSVPARYRVGYIYTGGSYENKIQSDASHAWVEVYLPWTGWVGLDPTNGCLASTDHIRVACGRQFRDAAPTAGTIYRGGGTETLSVAVRVERLDET